MKVPTPRKLKSGTWFIYLRLNGQAFSVSDRSKALCIAKAQSLKAQYKAGELEVKPPDKAAGPTLGALIDAYIAKYEPVLSPATTRGYTVIRRNRFPAYVGEPAGQIDYQKMVNRELASVSVKTVRNSWGLVEAALKDAGIPVPAVKLPPVPTREIPFLQPEEIKPLLSALEGDSAEIPALLMLHSLRYSEAIGLRWRDVDLTNGKLCIRGASVFNKDDVLVRKETNKNATSTRTVDIMIPRLTALLKEAAGSPDEPVTTLFHTVANRHIKAACRRAGVTEVSCHGLRHSFASLAYDLGWSERMIMDVGGWSNPATAHKIYIRIANSRRAENLNSMAAFYASA